MTVKLILKPHKNTDNNVIEIQDGEFYPYGLVGIELFWVNGIGADRSIHEALEDGETVTVELRMVGDPCLDPQ